MHLRRGTRCYVNLIQGLLCAVWMWMQLLLWMKNFLSRGGPGRGPAGQGALKGARAARKKRPPEGLPFPSARLTFSLLSACSLVVLAGYPISISLPGV